MGLNLKDILTQAEFILNKDQLGDPVKPETYQVLIKVINEEFFNSELKKINDLSIQENKNIETYIINDSALFKFKQIFNLFGIGSSPTFSIPNDYKRYISLSVQVNGQMYSCEILDEGELDQRISSVIGKSIHNHPIATIIGTLIRIIPNYFTGVKFTYLRSPAVPFYDYCTNQVDDEIYMPTGSQIRSYEGNLTLFDVNDNILNRNINNISGLTLPYISKSVEFEYDDRFIPRIIDLLVEKLGAHSREVLISNKS